MCWMRTVDLPVDDRFDLPVDSHHVVVDLPVYHLDLGVWSCRSSGLLSTTWDRTIGVDLAVEASVRPSGGLILCDYLD